MKMKRKNRMKFVILCIVAILIGAFHVQNTAADTNFPVVTDSLAPGIMATDIHKGAWSLVADEARVDPYHKYGIYTSRVLAVYHPEVYLKADAMFLRAVNNKEIKSNVRRGRIYTPITSTFEFDEVNLNAYEIVTISDFYEGAPTLPYVDQRAFSLASTLRRLNVEQKYIVDQDKITQLNKAILYYLRENTRNIYLIYCDNENAYIHHDGTLLHAETLKEASIVGNPILIFNEDNVWYPLMGRDDTNEDTILKDLVETYATDIQTPELTSFEESLIEDLRIVTQLSDEDQYVLALLSASRTYTYSEYNKEWLQTGGGPDDYITNDEVGEKWLKIFPDMDTPTFFTTIPPHPFGGVDFAIINEITKRGNYLSPLTARLAHTALTDSEGNMAALSRSYQDMGYSWSALWTLGMQTYTIDETVYTGAGTCQVHGYNIASVLDVAGIDNYILHGYEIGYSTHVINYVPGYDVVFTDGELVEDLTTILYCPKNFMFLSHEKWAFIVKNSYSGTLSPEKAKEYLSFLREQHHDDIKGLSLTDGTVLDISYEELIRFLDAEQEKWVTIDIPMTVLPSKPHQFTVENLTIQPEAVDPGTPVGVSVDVTNTGTQIRCEPVELLINRIPEARTYVTLKGGETTTVWFVIIKEERQIYHVDVEGLTGEFTVKGLGTLIIVIGALIAGTYFLIRFMKKSRLLRIAVKKVIAGFITIVLVMTMLFVLLRTVPGGDAVDRMYPFIQEVYKERVRTYWGLDKPIFYQYYLFMKKTFTFNFEVLPNWINASDVILYVLPFTLLLFGTAAVISYVVGALLGISLLSGKGSKWRSSVVYAFIVFYILPSFVLAIFFKSWFVFKWYIFPPVSVSIAKGGAIWDIYGNVYTMKTTMIYTDVVKTLLPEMVLPLIVLVLVGIARPLLLMRDHMALTLGEPHVVTARAKGLTQRAIRFKHVARCALLPLVNDASINLVYIFGGGILIEYVFKWPGVGYILFESLKILNVPLISAAIFILTCILVVSMIVADVVSAYLDPRIGVVQ